TNHPADEWIRQLVLFTPIAEPASTGPVQVEITEQAIVYIKSHDGVATHESCEPLTTDPLDLWCAVPGGTPQPNTYALFIRQELIPSLPSAYENRTRETERFDEW